MHKNIENQKVVALVTLEDQQQDFLELDVLENNVILGDSIIFKDGVITMIGIGTLDGSNYFNAVEIRTIKSSDLQNDHLYVYFQETGTTPLAPWEAKTLKYRVTGIKKAIKPNRFINK